MKYHGHREVERVQAPYDLKRTQSWTSFKEPDTLEYKQNSSPYTLLTGLSSMWNADGQMVVRERLHDDAGGSDYGEVFRYDRMGRLTTMWYATRNPRSFATGDGPVEPTDPFELKRTWTLGPVYERDGVTTKVFGQSAAAQAYTVNTHYQVSAGPASMSWNDNGYLITRGADAFAWTALGQLAQADIDGGDTLDYTYDAFGRRVKTVNDTQVNRFLYHGWHMIGEWDDTADEWLWQEAPGNSGEQMLEHIALDTSDVDTDENVSEYRQYAVHEDFQDTVWGLSDTSAAIAERYNYTDPYGLSDSEDASANALGEFATQVFNQKRVHGGFIEENSELYDFRNRWLDVSAASWIAMDSIRLPRGNLYEFVRANPLLLIDQAGLAECCPTKQKCNGDLCEASEYPCKQEYQDYVRKVCAAVNSSDPELANYSRTLCDHLTQSSRLGGGYPSNSGCANKKKCAETSVYSDGSTSINICQHWVSHPGGVGTIRLGEREGDITFQPGRSCLMCCKCDCRCLIDHEMAHVACFAHAVRTSSSQTELKAKSDKCTKIQHGDGFEACSKKLSDCFTHQTQGCLKEAVQCFKGL